MNIAALVLAAGSSRRMGTQNKLLIPLGSTPILRHVLEQLPYGELSQTILVTGHQHDMVEQLTESLPVESAYNPDHQLGIATSILAGLELLKLSQLHAIMICLGDMPHLAKNDYLQILHTCKVNQDKIVIPTWNGQHGNPVIFPRAHFDILQDLAPIDKGARAAISAVAKTEIYCLEMPNSACLCDIDKPSDL